MISQYFDVIRSAPLFQDIDDSSIYKMLECLQPIIRTLGENETALSAGESTRFIGIVLSGCMHGVRIASDGAQTLIAQKSAGDVYGEILACTEGTPSPVTIYAYKKSAVMLLDYERLVNICPNACGHHATLIRNILRIISRQYFGLHEKISYLSKKSLRARLCEYLCNRSGHEEKSQFIIPLSRSDLAEYIGADRSAMSRELGRMKAEGIVDFYKNSFKILDFSRLKV